MMVSLLRRREIEPRFRSLSLHGHDHAPQTIEKPRHDFPVRIAIRRWPGQAPGAAGWRVSRRPAAAGLISPGIARPAVHASPCVVP